jgi:hypothetical protein
VCGNTKKSFGNSCGNLETRAETPETRVETPHDISRGPVEKSEKEKGNLKGKRTKEKGQSHLIAN